MFDQISIASERQILFYAALDFPPNCPHLSGCGSETGSTAKSALPKTKLARFYLAYAE